MRSELHLTALTPTIPFQNRSIDLNWRAIFLQSVIAHFLSAGILVVYLRTKRTPATAGALSLYYTTDTTRAYLFQFFNNFSRNRKVWLFCIFSTARFMQFHKSCIFQIKTKPSKCRLIYYRHFAGNFIPVFYDFFKEIIFLLLLYIFGGLIYANSQQLKMFHLYISDSFLLSLTLNLEM